MFLGKTNHGARTLSFPASNAPAQRSGQMPCLPARPRPTRLLLSVSKEMLTSTIYPPAWWTLRGGYRSRCGRRRALRPEPPIAQHHPGPSLLPVAVADLVKVAPGGRADKARSAFKSTAGTAGAAVPAPPCKTKPAHTSHADAAAAFSITLDLFEHDLYLRSYRAPPHDKAYTVNGRRAVRWMQHRSFF